MAVAVSQIDDARPPTRAERRLAWLLRILALLFTAGAIGFLVRPDETVTALDRIGAVAGLPTLADARGPVVSDFWLAFAVADMATLATCAWLAAADVRRRRALVHAIVVSKLAATVAAVLLFARWAHVVPFLAIAVVEMAVAILVVSALRATSAPSP